MTRPRRRARLLRRRAVAALEFALTAPVLLVLVIGTIELVNAIRIQAKLNVAAGQLVELIANSTTVTTGSSDGPGGTLGDMCSAAAYDLYPYPATSLSAYIESTSVVVNWGLQTGQDWITDRSCPASRAAGSFYESIVLTNIADTPRSLFTLDGTPKAQSGTLVQGYSAISLQLNYTYQTVLPFFLPSTISFTAVASARPRSNKAIPCFYQSGTTPTPCPASY